MDNPLTKEQEQLRGKKIVDLSTEELGIWIDACERMEKWVTDNKPRRSWTKSREKAEHELNKLLSGKKKTIEDLLNEENISFKHEPSEKLTDFWNSWRTKFLAHNLRYNESQWHTFSMRTYSNFVEESEAISRYKQQPVKEYLIFTPQDTAIRCFSDKLPTFENLMSFTKDYGVIFDLYVSHKNFNWTFVITHEDDIGPYFAE